MGRLTIPVSNNTHFQTIAPTLQQHTVFFLLFVSSQAGSVIENVACIEISNERLFHLG